MANGKIESIEENPGLHNRTPHSPTRYVLFDKDGRSIATNANAAYLGELAGRLWPDQEQDEERTGNGWDIAVLGADRS